MDARSPALIARVLDAPDDEGAARAVRADVMALCAKFPLYPELAKRHEVTT